MKQCISCMRVRKSDLIKNKSFDNGKYYFDMCKRCYVDAWSTLLYLTGKKYDYGDW